MSDEAVYEEAGPWAKPLMANVLLLALMSMTLAGTALFGLVSLLPELMPQESSFIDGAMVGALLMSALGGVIATITWMGTAAVQSMQPDPPRDVPIEAVSDMLRFAARRDGGDDPDDGKDAEDAEPQPLYWLPIYQTGPGQPAR